MAIMRRGRIPFLLGVIFGGLGILLAVIAVVVLVTTLSVQSNAERTTGTVTEVVAKTSWERDSDGDRREKTSYYPKVRYAVDGQTYTFTSTVGSDPPAHQVGDEVPVSYDPDDPANARLATFLSLYLAPIILGGLAVLFGGVGIPVFLAGNKRLRRDAWLREHGREAWADVVDIAPDLGIKINGRHPYVVHASFRDAETGAVFTAASDPMTNDPQVRLNGRRVVRVTYDPGDPASNVVDLDAVPPPM